MSGPTAAIGRFPYPHRTCAEVFADEDAAIALIQRRIRKRLKARTQPTGPVFINRDTQPLQHAGRRSDGDAAASHGSLNTNMEQQNAA